MIETKYIMDYFEIQLPDIPNTCVHFREKALYLKWYSKFQGEEDENRRVQQALMKTFEQTRGFYYTCEDE